jgi:hypothetical protein
MGVLGRHIGGLGRKYRGLQGRARVRVCVRACACRVCVRVGVCVRATRVCVCESVTVGVSLNFSACACARGCVRVRVRAHVRQHPCGCVRFMRVFLRVIVRAFPCVRRSVCVCAGVRSCARATVFCRSIGNHLRTCVCVGGWACVCGTTVCVCLGAVRALWWHGGDVRY